VLSGDRVAVNALGESSEFSLRVSGKLRKARRSLQPLRLGIAAIQSLSVKSELTGGVGPQIAVRHIVAAPSISVHGLDRPTFVAGQEEERVVKV
jgi:hypothetical protein